MNEATGINENTEKANKHLALKLKAQRLLVKAQALTFLAETVYNTVQDNPELTIKEDELDKLSKDLDGVKDRLIESIATL